MWCARAPGAGCLRQQGLLARVVFRSGAHWRECPVDAHLRRCKDIALCMVVCLMRVVLYASPLPVVAPTGTCNTAHSSLIGSARCMGRPW